MQPMFETLLKLMETPLRQNAGVKTDNSILLIYPPEKELEFREELLDRCLPALEAIGIQVHTLDLTGFMFLGLSEEEVEAIQQDEFEDYAWTLKGLSQRITDSLRAHLQELAAENPNGNVVVYGTVALYPLVRFGEVLRDLRDAPMRLVLVFPRDERGGKLRFMKEPDGSNYLAIKLSWK